MPSVRVTLNPDGIRELLKSEEVRADLTRRMERVAEQARATAPVGATDAHQASIHVEQRTYRNRAVVAVVADSDHSMFVEAKTGHMAAALDAAGGD